ncbi:MAG: transcriptional repressor [Oscillospiraceae bacterium]|nr:transcriptional repressor [Oscillospiraceae bacterium]
MSKYMTRQRREMLTYLSLHADELLTAQEIGEALRNDGVSLSAVYRNLSELEADGTLRRESRGGSREAAYRFVGAERCRGCLHLSCKKCGRTFHMDAGGAAALVDAVAKTEGFVVDKADTVLYGICEDCRKC